MSARQSTKRERILTAAIRLWRETHNVKKVSLEDIAREAGVSPTTVYNNFGTRDGLVQEVIKHLTREMLDKFLTHPRISEHVELKFALETLRELRLSDAEHDEILSAIKTSIATKNIDIVNDIISGRRM